MSETPASYTFLPWMRRGVSADIQQIDGSGPVGSRATFPVTLVFNSGTPAEQATVQLALHGPGEIAGIDHRMIIRTDPAPDVMDTESNYFPLIEFDEPDFPWRYTPASATPGDRLRPWIVLIVLADDEISARTAADTTHQRLPAISLPDSTRLPKLDQSWAWAHVQVVGLDRVSAADADKIAAIDRDEPHRTISRLLCARHLKPRTAYTAFLVPAFERGRLAGLNLEIPETVDALTPAWNAGRTDAVTLPVYYQWRFQTADEGDFESLVRELLPPRVLSGEIGRRPMDATTPGAGLPSVTRSNNSPLLLQGALMSPACRDSISEWTTRDPFVGKLEQLLNLPTELLTSGIGPRAIAPPLYGRWHAARKRLLATDKPSWFDEINRDPQLRVIAAMGTQVVQAQQEQLMASAWDQVEGIRAANRQLREAELGCAVASRLVERDLLKFDPDTLVEVTAPILAKIMASPRTIQANLKASPIAPGVLQSQFRRITRPLGRIGRIAAQTKRERAEAGLPFVPGGKVLLKMNEDKLQDRAAAVAPRLVSIKKATAHLALKNTPLRRSLPVLLVLAALVMAVAAISASSITVAIGFGTLSLAAATGAYAAQQTVNRNQIAAGLQSSTPSVTSRDVSRVRPPANFRPYENGFDTDPLTAIPKKKSTANFQTAFSKLADRLSFARPQPSVPKSVDFAYLQFRIREATKPSTTITRATNARLLPEVARETNSSGPVMVAPVFDHPMYEPLRDLSAEWLLPGVEKIPDKTVSLLVSNQKFIESYLLGLNHEMGRELLWREYPTDQRGTYFRQFWDVRGYAGAASDQLHDITAIHQWPLSSPLGSHRGEATPTTDHLVLLIRGRLLRRYQNTVIYAVRATLKGTEPVARGGTRIFGTGEKHPLFFGTIGDDVAFVGFDLQREEVVGNDQSTNPADQGWFFVFQEQPSAPRFGLNVLGLPGANVPSWDDFSWSHLVHTATELESLIYIDLDPPLRFENDQQLPDTPLAPLDEPNLTWHAARGARSTDLAYITLQKPYRVGIHGSDMLPST